jgi:hypothetical protein
MLISCHSCRKNKKPSDYDKSIYYPYARKKSCRVCSDTVAAYQAQPERRAKARAVVHDWVQNNLTRKHENDFRRHRRLTDAKWTAVGLVTALYVMRRAERPTGLMFDAGERSERQRLAEEFMAKQAPASYCPSCAQTKATKEFGAGVWLDGRVGKLRVRLQSWCQTCRRDAKGKKISS